MNIGILGMGFVGGTTAKIFERVHKILPYDKYKKPYNSRKNIEDLTNKSEVVFICVPTPMKFSGKIDYLPINDSLTVLTEKTSHLEKRPMVIIRSTAVSETTDNLKAKYPI